MAILSSKQTVNTESDLLCLWDSDPAPALSPCRDTVLSTDEAGTCQLSEQADGK